MSAKVAIFSNIFNQAKNYNNIPNETYMILCINFHHTNSTDTVRDLIRLIAACRRAMRIGMHNVEKDNLVKTQYHKKPKNTYQMIHCQRVKVTVTS